MQTVGKQAREASRAIARADTNQKNRRCWRWPRRSGVMPPNCWQPTHATWSMRAPAGSTPPCSTACRSTTRRGGDGRRPGADRRAARSGRRNHRPQIPPFRHPGRQDAGAARRHRHHLRSASQRDGGCRRAVPQIRQRGDPARRLRGAAFQPGGRRLRARRAGRRRAARRRWCR